MRDAKSSGKRPVEEVEGVRPRKAKLELLRPSISEHKKAKGVPAVVREETLRKTGIGILGDVSWGTHFCMFYKTKQDVDTHGHSPWHLK